MISDYYYMEETIHMLNKLISKGDRLVNVKKIRKVNHIPSENRSKINFIWRNLDVLKERGILEIESEKTPRTYRLPNNPIETAEVD